MSRPAEIVTREWLSRKSAAALIDVNKDTIKRHEIPWQEEPVEFKVRIKMLDDKPRYFASDVLALLKTPKASPVGGKPKHFSR